MNYNKYILLVQDTLKTLSEQEKDTLILNLASRVNDEKRETFLTDLHDLPHQQLSTTDYKEKMMKIMKDILSDLDKIKNEEIYVKVRYHLYREDRL